MLMQFDGYSVFEVTGEIKRAMGRRKKMPEVGQLMISLDFDQMKSRLFAASEARKEKCRADRKRRALEVVKSEAAESPLTIMEYFKQLLATRERLIQDHMDLVYAVISKMKYPKWISSEELESEGRLALVKAAQLFDRSTGNSFGTYAYTSIRNAMIKMIDRESRHARKADSNTQFGEDAEAFERDIPDRSMDISERVILSTATKEMLAYIKTAYQSRPSILSGLRAMLLYTTGIKYCDIARAWNLSESHLSMLVSRARKAFRKDKKIEDLLIN